MFWERFEKLCNAKGIKPNPVAAEIGIRSGTVTKWKNGTIPTGETLIKIANYFNVSIDYLLGIADSPTAINSHNTVNGSNNIIGNGSGNKTENTLSEQETALMDIFNKLDVVSQAKLLVYATELEKEKEKE